MEPTNGIINIFLGKKSCFCGSISNVNHKFSLFVDFKANVQSTESNDVKDLTKEKELWDGVISKLDTPPSTKKINRYSPCEDISWSEAMEKLPSDDNLMKLSHSAMFHSFTSGYSFYKEGNLSEELEEKLRYLIEKQNIYYGNALTVDGNSGYSGFLPNIYALIDDVFGKKTNFTCCLLDDKPSVFELDTVTQNSLCSFINWKDLSNLKYDGVLLKDCDYHRSAVISVLLAQIHQVTEEGATFKDFQCKMSPLSRSIITSSLGFPFDYTASCPSFQEIFEAKYFKDSCQSLSLLSKLITPLHNTYLSCCGLRDITSQHLFYDKLVEQEQVRGGGAGSMFVSSTSYHYNPTPYHLPPVFPQFFSSAILSNGQYKQPSQKARRSDVTYLPVVAAFQNSSSSSDIIKEVLKKKIIVNKIPELKIAGVLPEDIDAINQRLHELHDNYHL